MPVADAKKAQTIRNLWHTKVANKIVEANLAVAAVRAAIAANSLADEFTSGELTAMQAVETELAALAASSGVTAAESKYRPGHSTDQSQIATEV